MTLERWLLPDSWLWSPAGDIATIIGGGTPSSQDTTNFTESGIPWLTPADLTGYKGIYIKRGARDLSEKGYKTSSAKIMPSGTVLYSSRAPIGYCVIAENEISTNQGFKNFVLHEGLIPEYFRYYLISAKDYAESIASGTTFKELSGSRVATIPIPIAPEAEQRRIVAKLDSLFERTRRAREELAHVPTLIEHYKQAILAAAFRGDLTADWRKQQQEIEPVDALLSRTSSPAQPRGGREATDTTIEGRAALSVNIPDRPAPPGWAWVSLMRIARQETGHTPSRKHPEYWDGDIPWIGIRDAGDHHGGIITDTIQHVTEEGLENSSARLLPKDTVCLSRTASVGYVIKMGREMSTSQDFATWTCSEALDPDYLLYALLAEGDDIRRFGKGSTHTTIYFPEIRALHICLAPLEEQHEIVRRVRGALAWVDRIAREQYQAYDLMPQLEQTLLSKAFQGELVPQDPDDEPASALLERIRAECGNQSTYRRSRKKSTTSNAEGVT